MSTTIHQMICTSCPSGSLTPTALTDLMARIHEDQRHEDVRIIMAHNVARRDFGAWDMALREVTRDRLSSGTALSEFFKPGFDIRSLRYGSPASFLLQAFHELYTGPGRDRPPSVPMH